MKRNRAAYTLLEVLIAACIIMIAVAAAAAMSLATLAQEEINFRAGRCLNLQEQAMRLYQLGLTPDNISSLLPPDTAVQSLSFNTNSLVITNLGTVEHGDSTLVFTMTSNSGDWVAGTWGGGESADNTRRTNVMTAIRPSKR